MKNLKAARIGQLTFLGARFGKIERIPDNMYNKLRYYYQEGVPLSFYILFNNIFKVDALDKCIFFTKVLKEDDYQIVYADKTVLGCRVFIVAGDKVYDPEIGSITDKDYYFRIYKPKDLTIMDKAAIEEVQAEKEISTLSDAENVDLDKLNQLDEYVKSYEGRNKQLYERQVKSYFNDINYEDGLLYIDINKKSM